MGNNIFEEKADISALKMEAVYSPKRSYQPTRLHGISFIQAYVLLNKGYQ
jgi:hypothetical protein